jgi:hypothetical protein
MGIDGSQRPFNAKNRVVIAKQTTARSVPR